MELKNISDFPALQELINFFKIDNQRVEARVYKNADSYSYVLCNGAAYVYNDLNNLVQSFIV